MTTQPNIERPLEEPTADQISAYLDKHPEFFDQHPEVLAGLRLAHTSGKAVSLIERQVQVLREQNEALKSRLMELVNVARDNDRLSGRMHQMTLDLLQAGSLMELLDRLEDHLRNEFKADAVAVRLAGIDQTSQGETGVETLLVDENARALFPASLRDGKPQCGRLKQQQLEFLFSSQAPDIESAAVIPLGDKGDHGLLAIGSREVNRFNPCMGTLFLSHLGDLLVVLLRRHVAD